MAFYECGNPKIEKQLVGRYSGNQTIDVVSFLQPGDSTDNFIIEIITVPNVGTPYAEAYSSTTTSSCSYSASTSGCTPTKTLSNSSLVIDNAKIGCQARVWNGGFGGNPGGAYSGTGYGDITYDVWYIG